MLQKMKHWIIIYFTLLEDAPSNSVFCIIENWALALPICLVQLMPPSLDQMNLLCSPFSRFSICGGAQQGFISPKMKSDISPALRIRIAHPCIPDMVNYSPVNKGLTLHKICPALHHDSNRLKQFTNRKKASVILPPSESIRTKIDSQRRVPYIYSPTSHSSIQLWMESKSSTYNALVL